MKIPKKFKLKFFILIFLFFCSFIGKNFRGFQSQDVKLNDKQLPVQDVLEKAISRFANDDVRIKGCGRTDQGVNARRLAFQFTIQKNDEKPFVETEKMIQGINYFLRRQYRDDISVNQILQVPLEFDANMDAKQKQYQYRLEANLGNYKDDSIQQNKLVWSLSQKLDIDKIIYAKQFFIGNLNYFNFTKKRLGYELPDYKRKIDDVQIEIYQHDYSVIRNQAQCLDITFYGQRFMTYQVRYMVGSLVQIGLGQLSIDEFQLFFQPEIHVTLKKVKAPPEGLFLKDVSYDILNQNL